MDGELHDVAEFLSKAKGFNDLDAGQRHAIAAHIKISYARRGETIIAANTRNKFLYIIRSGAVELYLDGKDFHMRLSEPDCFAYPSLMRDGITRNSVIAVEDCLLYQIPASVFKDLCANNAQFQHRFALAEADRLRHAIQRKDQSHLHGNHQSMLDQKLDKILRRREIIEVDISSSIKEGISAMVQADVSSLLVCDEAGLKGIVTDKDLRRRVLGEGRDTDNNISSIMTPAPITMSPEDSAFDALIEMTDLNIRHLPILEAGKPIGLISLSDLMGSISNNALHIRKKILTAQTTEQIAEQTALMKPMLVNLVDGGVKPERIGHLISTIGEAVHTQAMHLTLAAQDTTSDLVLLVFGSLARRDQTAVSDQDNGFLLPHTHTSGEPALSEDPQKIADQLASILHQAGYIYCPGDIMARNPKLRQSAEGWYTQFHRWITVPEPQSIMNTSIFFDIRAIGQVTEAQRNRFQGLHRKVVQSAQNSKFFLAHLAADCARNSVPLGLFRNFVLSRDKDHKDTLDLKHHGTAPIVDLARLYALAAGSTAVDTLSRLDHAASEGVLSKSDAQDISDAWRFITTIRLNWQANLVRNNKTVDNFVAPKSLSHFDRDHLKDAFHIVHRAQQAAQFKFGSGL